MPTIEEEIMSPDNISLNEQIMPIFPSIRPLSLQSHEISRQCLYSSLIAPSTLISPLKPFNEYSEEKIDKLDEDPYSENQENHNYDDFYGFESDNEVEVVLKDEDDVNEVSIEEMSEEDGEILCTPTIKNIEKVIYFLNFE